jgi:hypothetical protein
MPQIAITTGGADALECLLRGIGVDDAEFVAGPGGTGHVHLYNGVGGVGLPSSPDAQGLWNDAAQLSKYDVVMLSCEGEEHNENKTNMKAMQDYANMGGRVFATHFHYTWFKNGPSVDFKNVANWGQGGGDGVYDVDQSFPKGKAFAGWLTNVGASTQRGLITLNEVRSSVTSVNSPTQGWISKGSQAVSYFSFNTPLRTTPDQQCGRTVFGDLHVTGQDHAGQPFPDGCAAPGTDMTPEQKAMEFMFFDVGSCVQDDKVEPAPHK